MENDAKLNIILLDANLDTLEDELIDCSAIYLWNEFSGDPKINSLPDLVNKNIESIKLDYLKWVYDFGNTKIKGKSVVERLQIRDGYSFWWATSIGERNNFTKSDTIFSIAKLLAFIKDIEPKNIQKISVISSNKLLVKIIQNWSISRGYQFLATDTGYDLKGHARKFFKAFNCIKALVWIARYFILNKSNYFKTQKQVDFLFVDYFLNYKIENNKFINTYWGNITSNIKNTSILFLHIFVKNNEINSIKKAQNQLNELKDLAHLHSILESAINAKVFLNTIWDFFKILCKQMLVNTDNKKFLISGLNVRPLFYGEWSDSVSGVGCIRNLLYLNIFDSILGSCDKIKKGVYLQENQPWEYSFINSWQRNGHGILVGAPHATVRSQDFRYFYYPNTFLINKNLLPLPNLVAVNGPLAYDNFVKNSYPSDQLKKVEALRYQYLSENEYQSNFDRSINDGSVLNLLVATDYDDLTTINQIEILIDAIHYIDRKFNITIKLHPASNIKQDLYKFSNIKFSNLSLDRLIPLHDMFYTSHNSSAAVDAYLSGLPVLVQLNPETFNMSPLRGISDGVKFVTDKNDFICGINELGRNRYSSRKNIFFKLDRLEKEWNKVLAL